MRMTPEKDLWMWLVSRSRRGRTEYWAEGDVPEAGWYSKQWLGSSRTPAVLELEEAVKIVTEGYVRPDGWEYRLVPLDTRKNILWREGK